MFDAYVMPRPELPEPFICTTFMPASGFGTSFSASSDTVAPHANEMVVPGATRASR